MNSGESNSFLPVFVGSIPRSESCWLDLLFIFLVLRGFSLGTPVYPSPKKGNVSILSECHRVVFCKTLRPCPHLCIVGCILIVVFLFF